MNVIINNFNTIVQPFQGWINYYSFSTDYHPWLFMYIPFRDKKSNSDEFLLNTIYIKNKWEKIVINTDPEGIKHE